MMYSTCLKNVTPLNNETFSPYIRNKLVNKSNEMGSKIMFVGFMFVGLAIGLFIGQPGPGVLLGMGIGFIAQEIMKRRKDMWK